MTDTQQRTTGQLPAISNESKPRIILSYFTAYMSRTIFHNTCYLMLSYLDAVGLFFMARNQSL